MISQCTKLTTGTGFGLGLGLGLALGLGQSSYHGLYHSITCAPNSRVGYITNDYFPLFPRLPIR
jgi:hypothetical protein